MEISLTDLTTRVTEKLSELGAPADEVAATVEMCMDAEMRGHHSHGVRLIGNIEREYRVGDGRRRPIALYSETATSAIVDGGYHLSPFVHRQAVDLLAQKASESGIALVSVRHAGVSGALGYLVERIARMGLCAIALNSTPLVVVAPGSSEPALGTNPLGIAVPRQGGDPLVLDMATSAIAFNEVMRLRNTGGMLPDGVAIDAHGETTRDPGEVVRHDGRGRVLPFGGHRGYGLALMIELLVSGFATGRTSGLKRGEELHEPDDFGAIYIAFDPRLLGAGQAGFDAVESLLGEIIGAGGRLPGEQSSELRERRRRAGTVELDDNARQVLGL